MGPGQSSGGSRLGPPGATLLPDWPGTRQPHVGWAYGPSSSHPVRLAHPVFELKDISLDAEAAVDETRGGDRSRNAMVWYGMRLGAASDSSTLFLFRFLYVSRPSSTKNAAPYLFQCGNVFAAIARLLVVCRTFRCPDPSSSEPSCWIGRGRPILRPRRARSPDERDPVVVPGFSHLAGAEGHCNAC
jgi:hypothetical protein